MKDSKQSPPCREREPRGGENLTGEEFAHSIAGGKMVDEMDVGQSFVGVGL